MASLHAGVVDGDLICEVGLHLDQINWAWPVRAVLLSFCPREASMHASFCCRVSAIFKKNLFLHPACKKKIAEDGGILTHDGRIFDAGSLTDPGARLIRARGSKAAELFPLERSTPCCGVRRYVTQSNSINAFLKVFQ